MSPLGVPSPKTLETNSSHDVDSRTGFMAPQIPLRRLPEPWEPWEVLLDAAISAKLQPGDAIDITEEDRSRSERWRTRIREVCSL